MTQPITFFVPGTPQAQGNHRINRIGKIYDTNPKLAAWRHAVTLMAKAARRGQAPIDQPVEIKAVFLMPRPKQPRFNQPATSADLDKLQRAIGDSLEASGLLKNDGRIVRWDATKKYATQPQQPGVHIEIQPIAT